MAITTGVVGMRAAIFDAESIADSCRTHCRANVKIKTNSYDDYTGAKQSRGRRFTDLQRARIIPRADRGRIEV
jgi:hypothetical protein